MLINAVKSVVAVFGQPPPHLPTFTFGNTVLEVVPKLTYVGITFQSTHAEIFASHYSTKASKARVIGHAILGVESMIGSLPPYEGHKLYMARVDPHLTGGCKVVLDVHPLAQQLVDVQYSFLCQLLKVNNHAMIALLFTETCVIPLQFCRAQLAL